MNLSTKCSGDQKLCAVVWHVLAAMLMLLLTTTSGCTHDAPATAGAPAVQPAPAPVASMNKLDQLPPPVRDAFMRDRRDATVLRTSHRMMTDGVVHYTITSTAADGAAHTDEYRADGVHVGDIQK